MTALRGTTLPLPLWRHGKVREVYEVDGEHLLLVASDRVSAFDVVMTEPVPRKGEVLTQISAFWFRHLAALGPTHFLTADWREIVDRIPALASHPEAAGRSMLVRRTTPVPFECVVRGYLSGSAWAEYATHGTLAGEPMPPGLREATRLDPPIFSPATKAETGHDENVPFLRVKEALGAVAERLRERSLALFQAASAHAHTVGLILADTKFEFGHDSTGELLLIDEVLTPDSSRFWPLDAGDAVAHRSGFDKQPLRDHLAALKASGAWNGDPPPPPLPPDVIAAMTTRYLDVYHRLTGTSLPEVS